MSDSIASPQAIETTQVDSIREIESIKQVEPIQLIEPIKLIETIPKVESPDPTSSSQDARPTDAKSSQRRDDRPEFTIGCPPPVARSETQAGDPRIELIRLADSLARDRSASLLVRYLQLRRMLMSA